MLPATTEKALEFLGRGFPDCAIEVFDGHELEDGRVEEAGLVFSGEERIASFALLYATNQSTTVTEIRLGEVGQYCGTVEEQQAFQSNR